jgi:hypothetical protein
MLLSQAFIVCFLLLQKLKAGLGISKQVWRCYPPLLAVYKQPLTQDRCIPWSLL